MNWVLFMSGIMAGILFVWWLVMSAKYSNYDPIEHEPSPVEPEPKTEVITMTVEEYDEWYNNVMNIFAIKEA